MPRRAVAGRNRRAQGGKAADYLKIPNPNSIIKMLQRALYRTRSEKLRIDPLSDEQYAFALGELEPGLSQLSGAHPFLTGQVAEPIRHRQRI